MESLLGILGEPDQPRKLAESRVDAYRDRVPFELRRFWLKHGFGSYKRGYFWLCEPAPYDPMLEALFAGNEKIKAVDLTIVGYTSQSVIFVFDRTGGLMEIHMNLSHVVSIDVSCFINRLTGNPISADERVTLAMTKWLDDDLSMHDRALQQLGPLSAGSQHCSSAALWTQRECDECRRRNIGPS